METTCKVFEPMRVLKLREYWDKNDDNLVINNMFTRQGLSAYWRSIDASFQFNIKKREEFIVHNRFRSMNTRDKGQIKKFTPEDKFRGQTREFVPEDHRDILDFFLRHRNEDKYHWRNPAQTTSSPRFLLPRVPNFKH